ncbi:ketoacyl-synt-domain-containing protein [Lojkania enalia]|uniref:Ketoacyl-synt-domain-containing protein n=1 Tax=Lojkania enalia TaxID=147567 RepID=A0A9P4K9X4_9PLEO|nr:ketoacyl-synt-domain-containing protein [Didymosphaeria enalia]
MAPLETHSYDAVMDSFHSDPLAIVGFSLRFPQDAVSPESFWNALVEKRCLATKIPKERMNIDAFQHPSREATDTVKFQDGHFLEGDVGAFDAPFFSISPTEAAAMDPQQRGLLEATYHALENAGIPLKSVAGSKTAVYSGSFSDDHRILSIKDPERLSKYAGVGTEFSILANRLSWWFNFRGPSFNIDNACASGLTAFHLACQSLRAGEISMALVCGSNIISSIEQFLLLSNLSMLSPSGRSFSFDHRANGYGRGEGFGVIVIKTLSDALRNGDTIRAIVRATGANQDGRTPSLTSPSQSAQEELIRETYTRAGLDFKQTAFVEAHGTGTAMGDPIEARAIGNVFGAGRSAEEPLYVGAVKSNIGHLEGASGVAGIIKTVLALEKGIIPPNSNFERLNPAIDIKALGISFPQDCTPWPTQGLRRASINSFGFGGSNAHVVLDDAYNYLKSRGLSGHYPPVDLKHMNRRDTLTSCEGLPIQSEKVFPKVLIWSASNDAAMVRLLQAYEEYFARHPSVGEYSSYMDDLAYTLAVRRSTLVLKSFTVINSLMDCNHLVRSTSTAVRERRTPSVVFVFTGQGSQYARMGLQLCSYSIFTESLKRSDEFLRALGCEWSLVDELSNSESDTRINEPDYSQPICTALQIALVDLLRYVGLRPQKAIGHSSGEIAAAYSIGAISPASALKIAFHRGKATATLAQSTDVRGAMLAVGLSEAKATVYLVKYREESPSTTIVVACINSPTNVTLAGDEVAINTLKTKLEMDGVFARKLRVNVAYHSPHVTMISEEYRQLIGNLEPGDSSEGKETSMISSVTGRPVEINYLRSADYWVRNMESPVRFSYAISQATSPPGGVSDLLEIGPHAVLQGPIKDTLTALNKAGEVHYHSVLNRRLAGVEPFLSALGQLYCLGYPIDILAVNMLSNTSKSKLKTLADLPSYPFDHTKSYSHESRLGREFRLRKEARLDLLGLPILDNGPFELGRRWRKITRVSETPWVQDHVINDTTIYPAAGMLCMALEAARQMANPAKSIVGYIIKEAEFLNPLNIVPENEGTESHIYVRPLGQSTDGDEKFIADFKLYTRVEEDWVKNCQGVVQIKYGASAENERGIAESIQSDFKAGIATCTRRIDKDAMYKEFHTMGMQWGPVFQGMRDIFIGSSKDAAANIDPFKWEEGFQDHIIHPVTLDSIFQATLVALAKATTEKLRTTVPTRLGSLWITGAGISSPAVSTVRTYAKVEWEGPRTTTFSAHGTDVYGNAIISVSQLETTFVDSGSQDPENMRLEHFCYNICWKPDIDLLNLSEIATQYKPKHSCDRLTFGSGISSLATIVELIAFKHPRLHVLEINVGQRSVAETILKSSVIRTSGDILMPLISHYDFTDPSVEALSSMKEKLQNHDLKMSFSTLDISKDPGRQNFEPGAYDIVFASSLGCSDNGLDIVLENIRTLLKQHGKLVMTDASIGDWNNSLSRNAFLKIDFFPGDVINGDHGTCLLAPIEISSPGLNWPETIVVISSEVSGDACVASALCHALNQQGHTATSIIPIRELPTKDLSEKFCICLAELSSPILATLDEALYLNLRSWLSTSAGLLWVHSIGTVNPELEMITGVLRVCRSENPNTKYVSFAVSESTPSSITINNVVRIFEKTITGSNDEIELEYKEVDGVVCISRAVPATSIDYHMRNSGAKQEMCSKPVGGVSTLQLNFPAEYSRHAPKLVKENIHEEPLQPKDFEVRVTAVSLLRGPEEHITTNAVFGCAGIVSRTGSRSNISVGQAVFGLSLNSEWTDSRSSSQLFTPMPPELDIEKAAAMTLPFTAAYLALVQNAGLRSSERVLIENAADDFGQAGIQIAKYIGADVIASTNDESERQMLINLYGLPSDNIVLNKDIYRRLSGPPYVDVVYRSTKENKSRESPDILAPFGRIVQISRNSQALPMPTLALSKCGSILNLGILELCKNRSDQVRTALEAIAVLLRGRIIHQVTKSFVYPISQIGNDLAGPEKPHSALDVLQISSESVFPVMLPTNTSYTFSADATYVLAGGFGSIGRTICRWMASKGARNLIVLSRSGAKSAPAEKLLEDLAAINMRVECPKCDDSVFEKMTYEEWGTAIRPRIRGSRNLHQVLPKDMDFFLLLSSINGILGARFQANYAASNTFLDSFAHKHYNERVVSIDFGWYADTLAENDFLRGRHEGLGCVYPVTEPQLLGLLDYYCNPQRAIDEEKCQVMIGVAPPSYAQARGMEFPELLRRPLWRIMNALDESFKGPLREETSQNEITLLTLLESATSVEVAADIICNALVKRLAVDLGISEDVIDKERPVHAAGVDSLLAVELRNWFKKEIGINVSVFDIMGNGSMEKVCLKASEKKYAAQYAERF